MHSKTAVAKVASTLNISSSSARRLIKEIQAEVPGNMPSFATVFRAIDGARQMIGHPAPVAAIREAALRALIDQQNVGIEDTQTQPAQLDQVHQGVARSSEPDAEDADTATDHLQPPASPSEVARKPAQVDIMSPQLRLEIERMVCWPDRYLTSEIVRKIKDETGCPQEIALQLLHEVRNSQSGAVSGHWNNPPASSSSTDLAKRSRVVTTATTTTSRQSPSSKTPMAVEPSLSTTASTASQSDLEVAQENPVVAAQAWQSQSAEGRNSKATEVVSSTMTNRAPDDEAIAVEPEARGLWAMAKRFWKRLVGQKTVPASLDETLAFERVAQLLAISREEAVGLCREVQLHVTSGQLSDKDVAQAILAEIQTFESYGLTVNLQDVRTSVVGRLNSILALSQAKGASSTSAPVHVKELSPSQLAPSQSVPARDSASVTPATYRAGEGPQGRWPATVADRQVITGSSDFGPDEDNPESTRAYAMMRGDVPCLFVTGKAGTGKSHLLRYFVEHTNKRVVVVAPSGLAAVNVGGQTIHSFFRFPWRPINLDDIAVIRESAARELYRMVDTIIIDEVSMLNANQLDSIDRFMRVNGRDRDVPFGGAQIILFGDLFQLPPVISDPAEAEFFSFHYRSQFFFDAHVFGQTGLEIVELQKNYRQQDHEFVDLLNAVRVNQLSTAQQRLLNGRYQPSFEPPADQRFVTLTPTNRRADDINAKHLERLPGPEFTYTADVEGDFDARTRPADTVLKLRRGAQVIFVRNDTARRWVNGTLGQVVGLDEGFVEVEIGNGNRSYIYRVERETWEKLRYKFLPETGKITTEVVAKFTQYPLRLAWALTIHKSQGQTLDRVVVDLTGGAFAPGQVYVALSRCRSLDGLVLHTPIWRNDVLLANSRVIEFSRQFLP